MSLGWLSIGATNDITLTGLNVDNGTLYVDKVNNRVGIGSTVLSNILQVGAPSVGISTYNPLSSSGIAMFSNKYASPDTAGVNDFGATLWINSSYGYLQNAGASIGLGAVSSSTVDSTHTTYARISGVQAMDTDDRKGDFVIETTNVDKMYERIRVKAEGNVGIGLDDPVGRLHVNGNIISELGITNNGYRREKPVTFAFANSSTERVTNDTTLTMLAPAGTGRGWLARIDDGSELDPQSEYVNGVISSASDGVIFAVGTFTGVVSVYQEGGLVVETTFNTSERAYPQSRSGFVARYNDEGSIEGFAVVEYPDTVELTSVSLSGNSQPDVIVTGYLTKLDASNLIIYNSGSPISGTGSQEPVPGVANGGKVGFVIIYDFNLTFRRLVYIHTNEGLIGEVMPTNAVCYTNDPENVLYISGQFKASSGVINASTTNFPGVTDQGTVTTTPIRTNSYDVFLCRYNIDRVNKYLAPVWMTAVQNSTGTTNDNVEHPSRALSVDESVGATGGDVYMCGYSRSDTIRFYNNVDVEQTSFALTRGVSTQVGFMARYDKTGAIKWSAKIAGSNLDEEATIRSLTFHTDSKRLIVTGSFKGNSVTFFNSNSTTPVVSQEGLEDKFSAFVASYDCSPTSACNVAWTTKIQPKQQNVYGMIIDNDVNGNIYTSFHLVAASTTYDNVTTDVYTAFGLNPTSASYHSVSGVADYIGIVCYNPNGKVLFTGKIDGSGTENIRAMDVYGPNADDPSRLIVGMVSGGNSFNCYDMTGISFEFATNLFNTPTTNTTSAFVIQYPSFTFYLMDTPPVELGTVKKFINTTSNRAYVIPYYDLDGSLDTSFTNAIYAVPGGSSIELTHGAPESWYASKDTDASSVYVDKINGGVGIGTTDPQRLLHVEGEALIKGNLYIDGLIINPYITFGLSGAIGIGTTNPVGFLHIYKPDPRIILQNSVGNSEQTSGTLDLIQLNSTGARLTYDGREGVDSFFLKMLVGGVEQTPTALTVSNRTSVSPGFVGIGITQPTARLHVKDSFKIEVGSRTEVGSDYGLQQVRDWGYSNDQFEFDSTYGTLRSCVYAPTIGELGRWVACGYRYIVYSDDGGDTWTTANDTWSSTPVANREPVYFASSVLKQVNPGSSDVTDNNTPITNFAEYVWTNVNWLEAAPVAPSEEELPTLISDTTLSVDYSGFVKVSGNMTLTLPKPSTSQVGRKITIMKMDTDFFTTVRVTTVSGTNINGSESVWLGRSHNEDGTSNVNVSLGTVGTSSRYNLRVVWTGEFWNVTGPNNHPNFPDGVFIAVNRDGEDGDAKRLAYSYKHESQNWASTFSTFYENTIMHKYSKDGARTAFTAGPLTGFAGAVVLGYPEVIFYPRSAAVNYSWSSVAWSPELGLFVAVAENGTGNRVMTSSDGVSWTSQVTPADFNWSSVVWSPELGLFVAVAADATTNQRVMTSPNGINWTLRTAFSFQWTSVVWAEELGLFVAVGASGTCMTSPDGINWTGRSTGTTSNFNDITWSPELGRLVAVASTGSSQVLYSNNGTSWSQVDPPGSYPWRTVTWASGLGLFIALPRTDGGNVSMTSPDGINWTVRTTPVANYWTSVKWVPELKTLVAIGYGTTNNVMTSTDGINWEANSTAPDSGWRSIVWSKELKTLVAVASSGTFRVTSTVQSNFLTPRDVKVIGSGTSAKAYICGLYEASSIVTLDTGKTLPATGGVNNAYIIKLSASGAVDWVRSIPSTANGIAFSVAIDSSNNVYVTGQYNSTTTVGLDAVTLPSTSGNNRLFVVKLNSSGTFVNAYGHPSANGSAGKSVLVRGASDVFLSGILNSSTMFLGRCTQSLGSFDFSTTITSPTLTGIGDIGPVIATNTSGTRIYLAGRYKSNTSISVGSYTLPAKPLGNYQGFLISFQINAPFDGFTSVWGTAVITSSDQYSDIRAITVDGNGDVFVTGSYESNVPVELTFGGAVLPITYKYGAINPEPQSTFVASYNSQGKSQWANTIQNTVSGYGNSIVRDSSNDIYVTGVYRSDPGKKLFIGINSQSGEKEYLFPNSAENIDVASVFLIKYSNNGNVLWARNHGMDTNETQYPVIEIDGSNNIYWAMDLMGITRTYNANTDKYEAGERWFIINFGNNDFYWRRPFVTSAYDSMNNRLVLLDSTATTYYTTNSGRDNPLAGRFWDPSIYTNAAWNRDSDIQDPSFYDSAPTYVTASFYKQGSRTTNSYIMTSRDASTHWIGNLWFLRSSDQDVFFFRIVWSVAGFFSPFNKNFQDLAYSAEQNKFVMCANSGTRRSVTLTLTNDENFTGSSISVSDFPISQSGEGSDLYDWRGVAWAPELGYYVVVSFTETDGFGIYASKDGATWTSVATPFTKYLGNDQINFRGVAWGSKTGFVAVGDNTDNKIAVARSFRYPTPPNSLVDTQTALDINGNTIGNLVFGDAPFYTPLGDSPLYMARAWVVFNGTPVLSHAILRKEGNISAVTRKFNGVYEISFREALPTVNYAIFVTSSNGYGDIRNNERNVGIVPSQTKFRITCVSPGNAGIDVADVSVMVIY